MFLVDLIYHMWRTGEISQELGWTILVLISKLTINRRCIVLLESLIKVMEALIDTCIRASLQMHNVIHGFMDGRGTGTDIMDLKLAQELASIDQDPLFLIFLDLRKDYGTMDRDRILITLEGYGAGPWMCGILETFWYFQMVVPSQNVFHRPAFNTTRGTTQDGHMSPILFNVVVNNVIRTCLATTVEDQRVAYDGLGETFGR